MAQSAFGLTSLYDPSIAVDQSALERQMALAQALRQQSMTPVETAGRQIGGVAYKVSPWEGLAKALQAYQANQADATNDKSRLSLMQKTAAAMGPMLAGMFGDGAAAAPVDPNAGRPPGVTADAMTSGGFPQPPAAPAPSANESQLAKLKRGAMAAMMRGDDATVSKLVANYLEFTPEQKNNAAKGIDPARMGAAELGEAERKARAPTRLGNGAYATPEGQVVGLPTQIAGSINTPAPGVPGGWQTVPVPGGAAAIESEKRAAALGGAAGEVFLGRDANGQPLPVRSKASVLGGGSSPAPATPGAPRVATLQVTEPSKAGGIYGEAPIGTENAQKGLDTSWEKLKADNREAQNTKSYLQNIVTAAEKGAIVGPGADRRELIQGMLQLAGIKEEVNTNATTQTQLLDKYSNQIVARLGQGGLGTDAARTILASAYPGKHMNVDAIREAVGNLSGAQDMTMAKMRFLSESGIKRDTKTFQERELVFDQAADPRIWQYKAIRDPERRKAFARELIQQDPTLPQRIQKLESLGAL